MSLITDVEEEGLNIVAFLKSVVIGGSKMRSIFAVLSGPTLAVLSAIFYDVMKAAMAGESVAQDAQQGNIVGAVQLSETTLAILKQLVTDFKNGEKTIKDDLVTLGIVKGS